MDEMYVAGKIYAMMNNPNTKVDMNEHYSFPGVTLLITIYNRSRSLERLLTAFKTLNCQFEDIVVSDDGSRPEHLEAIKVLQSTYPFRLITAAKNSGLGHNINKGQQAVTTPYTLYVQEDFVPRNIFPNCLKEALQYMDERRDLDLVRFYSYFKYPYLIPVKQGFSEMQFRAAYPTYRQYYMYSDHPHLRRSNFLEKFGPYIEGKNVDVTEYKMMISFLQNKGKALYYENHKDLFDQLNSADEPSTTKRNFWRESNNLFVASMRHIYRHVKFRMDYLLPFKKKERVKVPN
jgi:glycosyltransferase involved in cell wall biosynthesis